MNKSHLQTVVLSLVAALLTAAGLLLWRQAEIARSQAELERLRQQLTECQQARLASQEQSPTPAEQKQREATQTELLRLRGEVGRMRQEKAETEKLRKENSDLTAALAKLSQANHRPPEEEADPERQLAVAHLNDAKQLVLGLLMFADDNQQALPATLNQTSNYWGQSSRLLTNQFELVLQRPFSEVENPSAVIAVRQKEAWLSQGNWVKAYGFADGHAELKRQPPEGFDAWEQAHMQRPR